MWNTVIFKLILFNWLYGNWLEIYYILYMFEHPLASSSFILFSLEIMKGLAECW